MLIRVLGTGAVPGDSVYKTPQCSTRSTNIVFGCKTGHVTELKKKRLICVHGSYKEGRHNLKACVSSILVCSAFKSFFSLCPTASYLHSGLSISLSLPLFHGLLGDGVIVCVWGCVDKREPISKWETAPWLTIGACCLQGLSPRWFGSGRAHFLGGVSTWAPSVCAFYFLLRGSSLRKLVTCQRESDRQDRVSALG